jgi:hypothetical protein
MLQRYLDLINALVGTDGTTVSPVRTAEGNR